jgi:predicted TPR repeat methyltransferase
VGCDLSGGMIEQARRRAVYDDFRQGELTAFLHAHPGAFDLVTSADTLIYFGDLHDVLRAAAGALRVGGWLAFTLEALPDDSPTGHRLMPHGRFAHTLAHIRSALDTARLSEFAVGQHVLRMESNEQVHGWLVTARREY